MRSPSGRARSRSESSSSPSPATRKHTLGRAAARRMATSTKRSGRLTAVRRPTNVTTGASSGSERRRRASSRSGTDGKPVPGGTTTYWERRPTPASSSSSRTWAPTATRRVVRRGERSLHSHHRTRLRGGEVAGEQVPVEGVDGRRHPVGPRRGAPEDAGLGLVRVHDVGPELPDDAADLVERLDVAPGVRFAPEARDVLGVEVGRPQRGVVALLGPDGAREDALVEAVGVETSADHRHEQRGPADVEPVDDLEHTDGLHRVRLGSAAPAAKGAPRQHPSNSSSTHRLRPPTLFVVAPRPPLPCRVML